MLIALPFVAVFACPIGCAAIVIGSTARFRGQYDPSKRKLWRYILVTVLTIIAFGFGLVLDIIVVPLSIIIGVPAFIIFIIIEKLKKRRNARIRLA
jgi:hypothetical protein